MPHTSHACATIYHPAMSVAVAPGIRQICPIQGNIDFGAVEALTHPGDGSVTTAAVGEGVPLTGITLRGIPPGLDLGKLPGSDVNSCVRCPRPRESNTTRTQLLKTDAGISLCDWRVFEYQGQHVSLQMAGAAPAFSVATPARPCVKQPSSAIADS